MDSAQSEGRRAALERARIVSRTCEVPDVSYRAFLSARDAPRVHWAAPDGLEIVGAGAATRLTATGPDRFDVVRERAASLFERVDVDGPPATRPRLLGGLAFTADHESGPPWEGFPAATFVLPRVRLTRAADATWLTVSRVDSDASPSAVERELDEARERVATLPTMQPSGTPPGVSDTHRTPSRDEWVAQVEQAVDRIRSGGLEKVVLATALDVELRNEIDVPDVLERFRRSYPSCYRFLVQPSEAAAFFGPPPERLVRMEGRHVETEALAGSVPRGDTPEEDDELAASLVESEKIRHEQQLVVDAICDRLAPLGEVTREERGVRKLANIQHLRTPVTADLDDDEHVLRIVEALHPTPAVGGLPPGAAVETIRDAETFDRGWYAAPVGWFDADGDGEFAVGIRSAVASDRRATLFAGNGIVADSDPDDEWAEIQPKYRPVLDELE